LFRNPADEFVTMDYKWGKPHIWD